MFTEQMKLVHRMVRVAFTHEMAGFALEIATGLCIAGLDDATCVRRVENGLRDRAFSHEMSLKKEKLACSSCSDWINDYSFKSQTLLKERYWRIS